MSRSSPQITVVVSDQLLAAIDAEAFEGDESRAACVRRIVTDELRDLGRMGLKSPPTRHLGMHNPRYRAEGRT